MSNITPDSQLSAYELIQRSLVQINERDESQHSPIVRGELEIQNEQLICNIQNDSQQTIDDTLSQSSFQKWKRCTHEEAQLHRQKIEHDRWLKRQRKMDERVSAEAHRLQQAEMQLAQQESQKMCKTRFLWNEESTKQLLDLMMEIRFDYESLDSTLTGFVPWARYFKSQERRKEDYSTLKNFSFDTLDQRYKALMTSYRIIRDACEATGGGGLFCQLQRHNMTDGGGV
ncbi:hypothetical protein O181_112005 [Austropuccinia psidii MF-1]|uniref:Uncharacterized protein n=1 Tax=Austropuccinia psidii MF-1 TaxID=1389203 RepID=A0A9Q3K3J8_9BASI|nr:hypothetical protein [Austropuccinia psidii MF-1]